MGRHKARASTKREQRAAESLALDVTKHAYAEDEIDLDEFERRVEAITRGEPGVFEETGWLEMRPMGSAHSVLIATSWKWPGG
jgi:hypothetical protein